jgi:hypothetical protein
MANETTKHSFEIHPQIRWERLEVLKPEVVAAGEFQGGFAATQLLPTVSVAVPPAPAPAPFPVPAPVPVPVLVRSPRRVVAALSGQGIVLAQRAAAPCSLAPSPFPCSPSAPFPAHSLALGP